MLFAEYRRSLKMKEAEEFFDLIFYRPAAYVFVLGAARTPITPNQITILSLIAGCIAAYYLSLGASNVLFIAGIWYAIANILDCADGQLARIKKNGTPLGRVVDGVADYVSSVAIFLGIGFGLAKAGNAQWWLVIAAGVSSALHAIKFDDAQGRYISIVRGEEDFNSREIEKHTHNIAQLKEAGNTGIRYWVLTWYLAYLKMQQRFRSGESHRVDSNEYRKANYTLIGLWTLLGPTTNRTLLILSALVGNVEMFLWIVVVPCNVWLVVCMILQKNVDSKLQSMQRSIL